MGLDITLTIATEPEHVTCNHCGHTKTVDTRVVFEAHITHNVHAMAMLARVYEPIWHPWDNGVEKAKDLIPGLSKGLQRIQRNRGEFNAVQAWNGWGTRVQFEEWLERLLKACTEYPEAKVGVTR
jgi:hypothetical protein